MVEFGHGSSKVTLNVHVDKLGLTYYIYMEEVVGLEAEARLVRSRTFERFSSGSTGTGSERRAAVTHQKVKFTDPAVTAVATFEAELIHVQHQNPHQM